MSFKEINEDSFNNHKQIHLYTKQSASAIHPELHRFLSQIEHHTNSWLDQPYYAYKNKVDNYKIIFLCFGILFFILGLFIFYKQPNWVFNQLLWDTHFIKYIVFGFSWGLSVLSCYIVYNLKTEQEVLGYLASKGIQTLGRNYRRLAVRYSAELQQAYIDAKNGIKQVKEEYSILLQRIAQSDSDRKTRETLFNQTLLQFMEICGKINERFS